MPTGAHASAAHAETPLKATKATTTMLFPAATAGAAARGGGPHTETPLKATKATKTMLLPAAATAGLRRPRGCGWPWCLQRVLTERAMSPLRRAEGCSRFWDLVAVPARMQRARL
ncbi:hypothetical protein T492DRAFT_875425 [Pavlovales sp. CCMP2436]|nr:hypothetical protein T492DRAFT_875425 [Pavlovales sp. CCMP2436]